MKKGYVMDMSEGPLAPMILRFVIPLMLSSFLQLFFNAADMIVAGRFAGAGALAAVGSTSALISLIINVFLGLSIGCNVVVAGLYGSKRVEEARKAVHTSVTVSLIGGAVLSVTGVLLAAPLLSLMGTPPDIIGEASRYMRIYFLGMPVIMLYNFGSAIFRALGDTRRPLMYLTAAGVINVGLNIIFVTRFGMGVAGVAWATIISQFVSTSLLIRAMLRSDGVLKLEPRKLGIDTDKLRRIMKIGLPAGVQSVMFSLSNVLLQSSVNSLGSLAVAGCTADGNIESFVYCSMNAYHHATISFTAQNLGSGKLDRVRKILYISLAMEIATGLFFGWGVYLNGARMVSIYNTDPDVIRFALQRMSVVSTTYFLCGMQEVLAGYLRGVGRSVTPAAVSAVAICGVRILWIYTAFPLSRTVTNLFISYPLSWSCAVVVLAVCIARYNRKSGISSAGKKKKAAPRVSEPVPAAADSAAGV